MRITDPFVISIVAWEYDFFGSVKTLEKLGVGVFMDEMVEGRRVDPFFG